ncbi:MAG: SusD/RagB family nutrient-binding outer membrane lipoprotein [Bacteroidales bacterium]|nr:SusD/RagB family nutrient-binding outer membrane lipoprotein [Bacteroidales bacterium]
MNIYIKLAIGLSLFATSSCTKDFDELNQNPNNPDSAPLANVLAYNIIELSDRFDINEEMEYAASYIGHVTMGQNNEKQNYIEIPPANMWNQYYRRNLTNLNGIIKDATTKDANVKGAALVIKSYATLIQVDAYGSVPYSEASRKTEGIDSPKFDSEKEIYYSLLESLKDANTLFSVDAAKIGAGDLLYGNLAVNEEVLAWKKFANSLRLRLAIRISNVDEVKSKEVISEILNDATKYPIFESNDDNAILSFPGGDWVEPWTDKAGYKPYIKIAAPIVDTLKKFSDPRISQYASTNSVGNYEGLQVGDDESEICTGFECYGQSGVNAQFVKNPDNGKVIFLTYSEVEFIKAEAYHRGFASGDANEAYKKAIRANMEYYNIDETKIVEYIDNNAKVDYNGNVNNIYIQKWISLFRQSWEAWAEMRRTDVPNLPLAKKAAFTKHSRVPYRFAYPISEKNLNGDNIPKDVINTDFYWGTKIWWDTRGTDVY